MSKKLTPVIDGDLWHIGDNPDLGELDDDDQEIVDHAIWQSDDGRWHLWACIRKTKIGRLLYAWEGESLETPNWEPKGIAMRAKEEFGESIDDWNGEEWIQAPYVFKENDLYYMVYGGHRTESGECQICLATSKDGREFTRHSNALGQSRLFVGPGQARDPMVIKVNGTYYCYYTGNAHDIAKKGPQPDQIGRIYCNTSPDLLHWYEPDAVAWGGKGGAGRTSAECPFVVEKSGYYYLFRTSNYAPPAKCHVYRSEDPLDFGQGDDSKQITTLRASATEIIQSDSSYYISTVEDLQGGVQLAKLDWEEPQD